MVLSSEVVPNDGYSRTARKSLIVDGAGSPISVANPLPTTATISGVSSVVLDADGQVKATSGVVYAVHLSFVGVTAGDKIEIKNSTDNSGTSLITLVAPVAAGSIDFCPCVGSSFSTGIYLDETKTGGTFTATVVYA